VDVTIRVERAGDEDAISAVHRAAFAGEDEVQIVERIRAGSDFLPGLSLVAEDRGAVVGHVILSRGWLDGRPALGLGPIGVVPDRQGCGIGAALMHASLEAARTAGEQLVVLLGHPSYYPRFGFVTASTLGITPPFDVPDEAFMALELKPGAAQGGGGFTYASAFGP
jgi:putative acetyltransferase